MSLSEPMYHYYLHKWVEDEPRYYPYNQKSHKEKICKFLILRISPHFRQLKNKNRMAE